MQKNNFTTNPKNIFRKWIITAVFLFFSPIVFGQISLSSLGTNISCNGAADGTASVVASGGTSPYTYVWSNGSTSSSITSLSAGTYSVLVTDASSATATVAILITEPSLLTGLSAVDANVTCNGGTTGAASVATSGGTTPLTFAWSNGGSTSSITGLAAGGYSVVVTDANGCTVTSTLNITEPTAIVATANLTASISCSGAADGELAAAVSGGVPGYSYLWSNGSTSVLNSGLSAGTYSFIATDANGCTAASNNFNLIDPTAITISSNILVPITCNGGNNGEAEVIISGGLSPYFVLWSSGGTANIESNLSAGSYTVDVLDANFCITSAIVTIIEPALITATASVNSPILCAGLNGQIGVTVSGGVGTLTYLWSNGSTSPTPTVTAGIYSVVVTDGNLCTATTEIELSEPGILGGLISSTPINCSLPAAGGTANVSATGGTLPYSYLWSNGSTSASATGLMAGNYTATVSDANGCTYSTNVTISITGNLSVSLGITNVLCFGEATGSITANPSGNAPYTYAWSNLANTQTISGQLADTYSVTVVDVNGCSGSATGTITQPAAILAVSGNVISHVLCNGGATGAADATVTGGTSPYSYAWSTGSTATSLSSVIAGGYTLTVTDANGCIVTTTLTITEPTLLTASAAVINQPSCFGLSDGSIIAIGTNGTPGYSYQWNNGATTATLSGVAAGTYDVIVTDANGCTATASAQLVDPAAINLATTATHVTCNLLANGQAEVTISGGFSPFIILWSSGGTAALETGLSAGTYTVDVLDANFCSASTTVTITEPTPVVGTPSIITPILCASQNGTIGVTGSGGTAPYTYVWNTGATTQNITTIAGSYTVVLTDANGCTAETTIDLTEPGILGGVLNATNINCAIAGSTGTLSASATGGTLPYSYAWSNGATTSSISGLAPGSYSVVVTDANGCTYQSTSSVSITGNLVVTLNITNVLCFGEATGSITANATGNSPYTYAWSNFASTQTISSQLADTYSVSVADANGCSGAATGTITQPSAILAAVGNVINHVLCNGGATGAADATVTGGTTPYTYSWNNGNATSNISSVSAGGYTLTVTDANGCIVTTTVLITQPNTLVASAVVDNAPTCAGGSDGSVSASGTDGTPGYSYLWNTGATTGTLSGISAGTYSVIITDANGCTSTASVQLVDPAAITIASTLTHVTCNGLSNGQAEVTMTGGTSPYLILWSSGGSAALETGLGAGTYTVEVLDANFCSASTTVTITEPAPIVGTPSIITPILCATQNGTIGVIGSGGTAPYTYAWNTGATTQNITTIAGSYTVVLTDANGCTAETTIDLTEPGILGGVLNATNINCAIAGGTGSLSASVTGGTLPYSYAWSNGATTSSISGLAPGAYNVVVTDANGCTYQSTSSVSINGNLVVTLNITNVLCFGEATGSITANATGNAPYTYAWSNFASTQTISSLLADTYSVSVADANGCSGAATGTITQPAAILAVVGNVTNHVLCNGGATGAADATVTGGTTPYTYSWNNGSATSNISSVSAGGYTLTVTDANGCVVTTTVLITQPNALVASAVVDNAPTCAGGSDGSVSASGTDGTPGYSYLWNTGATTGTLSGISAGTYSVTITDANGCTSTASVQLVDPAAITIASTLTHVTCNGLSNGQAEVTMTGGTSPYLILWSSGGSAALETGLGAGTYTVEVLDANFCSASTTVTITEPAPIVGTPSIITPILCASQNGTIGVIGSGGTAPYTYVWNTGATTQNITTIAGSYTVVLTDANGCTAETTIDLTEPGILGGVLNATNINCAIAGGTGSLSASVTGGTLPYSYAWSNGATTSSISGLAPGAYSVVVTDANGCTYQSTSSVSITGNLVVTLNITNVLCFGEATGSITANATGNAPYTYAWSNFASTQTISSLLADTYSVSVADANGCSGAATGTITQPAAILAVVGNVTNHVLCNGGATGVADATVTGGTTPYTYSWNNGSATSNISSVSAGGYTLTVTDANGCIVTTTVLITQPNALVASAVVDNAPTCAGGSDGSVSASGTDGTPGYSYLWNTGATTGTLSGISAGTYSVIISDANGCTSTASVQLVDPAAITIASTLTHVTCNGLSNGQAEVTLTGGTSPYLILWSSGGSAALETGLSAGTYTVEVLDANFCSASTTVTITEPTPITATPSIITPILCASQNGTIGVVGSGGTAPYTYAWNTGATTQNITTIAGSYTVVLTDANGCTAETTIDLTEPGILGGILTPTAVNCAVSGSVGSLNAAVTGGTLPYTYLWSNGATTSSISGITPGTYSVVVTDANGLYLPININCRN